MLLQITHADFFPPKGKFFPSMGTQTFSVANHNDAMCMLGPTQTHKALLQPVDPIHQQHLHRVAVVPLQYYLKQHLSLGI